MSKIWDEVLGLSLLRIVYFRSREGGRGGAVVVVAVVAVVVVVVGSGSSSSSSLCCCCYFCSKSLEKLEKSVVN